MPGGERAGHPLELSLTGDDRPLFTTPLSHSAGAFLWSSLAVGATSVVRPEYDVEETLSLVEGGVTWTFMVPTMIYRLLDSPALDGADTGPLRTLVYGAAPMRPDRLREGVERLGPVFLQFYGQTEVPNLITTLGKQEHATAVADGHDDVLGSAGRPALLTDVKVVDRSGEAVPTGETGEILAAAPYAFSRYLGRPDETARTLRDGWVHTGDLGFRDEDGFVHLVDRKTDVVITGGMNVYTQEIEPVLAEHPGVEAVAVIGVPDPEWGEAVCAIVVPTDPDAVTANDLRAFADERLADYKKPKQVRFVERLPTTPYGKLDKSSLRERYADRE
ncbi:AMP-binding protein [Halobacteriaceae archaeon GCM10025711]